MEYGTERNGQDRTGRGWNKEGRDKRNLSYSHSCFGCRPSSALNATAPFLKCQYNKNEVSKKCQYNKNEVRKKCQYSKNEVSKKCQYKGREGKGMGREWEGNKKGMGMGM